MFTLIKTKDEIVAMRASGRILASVLKTLSEQITSGMSTKDLADLAKSELKPTGGLPSFLGYFGYPDVLCVSLNDEVVHGIPRANKIIRSGDLVSMDFGVTYDGMITDAALSVIVDKPRSSREAQLLNDTKSSLEAGISVVQGDIRVGDRSWLGVGF